jgi:hypothetical protein
MPTPYSTIYEIFLSKLTDYTFINLTDAELENIFIKYLKSSIVQFKQCKTDLTDRNEESKQFNQTLADEEIEILANQMIVEYLNPQIVNLELIRQSLGSKDFKLYSQSAHLEQLIKLRQEKQDDVNKLIISYTYNDLSGLND